MKKKFNKINYVAFYGKCKRINVKLTQGQATKVQRGSRDIAPLCFIFEFPCNTSL